MDLAALRAELRARGADYLDGVGNTRTDRFLNRGYTKVCNAEPWPFLYASTTGTAPLTISDLRNVRSVVDTTHERRLSWIEDRHILDEIDTDLTTTGTPDCWYLTSDSAVAVYPVDSAATISVRYVKKPAALSATTDEPVIPEEFHLAVVDAAFVEVLKDSDNYELRAAARADLEETLEEMRDALLLKAHSDPERVRQSYKDF